MKRIISTLFFFGLSIILVASCAPLISNSVTITPTDSSNWWTTWLTKPACQPPCWQNITPGVTTRDEAVSILEKMSEVTITYNKKSGVTWYFGSKTDGGNIKVSEDEKVTMIWLENSSSRNWHLETIVTSYDFPKYVQAFDCRNGMCITTLIYPNIGMFLDVFVENKGTSNESPQVEILPDTIVDRVYFIEPGMENFQKMSISQSRDSLMDWKGYGKYP